MGKKVQLKQYLSNRCAIFIVFALVLNGFYLFFPKCCKLYREVFVPNQVAENFNKDLDWSVEVTGPECPTADVLHLVKSSPKNGHMRKLIRKYFTEMKARSDKQLEILFLFGNSKSEEFEAERQEYNDFIIGNFTDSYLNLPWKTFTGYTYLNKFCSSNFPNWIVFQDDDTFVDSPKLANFLNSKSPTSPQFYCPRRIASPVRGPEKQTGPNAWVKGDAFLVNETLWNLDYYPVYCAGPCTIMSAPAAHGIYSAAIRTNFRGLPIEDVLFTGIIRRRANLPQPTFPWAFPASSYCTHYNDETKFDDLKLRTNQYFLT